MPVRLILTILFFVVCITVYIIRSIHSRLNNQGTENLFKKALSTPVLAQKVIDTVELLYIQQAGKSFYPEDLKDRINRKSYGPYTVLGCVQHGDKLLIHAVCSFSDSGITWDGKSSDVAKTDKQLFVAANHPEENMIKIFGEFYQGINDKNMKTKFAEALISEMA